VIALVVKSTEKSRNQIFISADICHEILVLPLPQSLLRDNALIIALSVRV